MIRRSIRISRDTDRLVRLHLTERGRTRGDLSRFVDDAVRRAVFDETVREVQARNRGADPAEIEADIEAALAEVRAASSGRDP